MSDSASSNPGPDKDRSGTDGPFAAPQASAPAKASGWRGRKFLVVADHTPESLIATHYAAHRARATSAHVVILAVIEPADFQHWAAVGERMRAEALQDAESVLYDAAKIVNEVAGQLPEWVIREGNPFDEIKAFIAEEKDIRVLVVGSAAGKEGPGPLVSRIASDWAAFRLPVVIVPGVLSAEEIKSLA